MIQDKYLEEQHRFFKDNPPVVFATRDPMTYQMFADDVPSAYDGVLRGVVRQPTAGG
jgi:hypothetical protein